MTNLKTRIEQLENNLADPDVSLDDPAALFALVFSPPEIKEGQKDELAQRRAKAFSMVIEIARRGDFLEAMQRRGIDTTPPPVARDEDGVLLVEEKKEEGEEG